MHPHRAWAEIDLDALSFNLKKIQALAGTGIMLVVKADAYGHGAVAVSHHALRCGVQELGVGDSQEALELRSAGVRAPLLVLGTVTEDEIPDLLDHQVEIVVHSTDRVRSLNRVAAKRRTIARVHLNIDTGMGRLGIFPEKASEMLTEIAKAKSLRLVGLMTHLASAQGMNDPRTHVQLEKFDRVFQTAKGMGFSIPKIHCSNSAALFTGMNPRFDLVRPGIAAYGILPQSLQKDGALKPVLSLKTQIIFLKDHPGGSSIGYNGRYVTKQATRIATLPIGYNDGVPYRLGNRGYVLVRGKRAPIVGSISMDYTTVDIGQIPGARVGDLVTVIGRDGNASIHAEEIASALETIPYEITCAIGKRVRREYIDSSVEIFPAKRREKKIPGQVKESSKSLREGITSAIDSTT